MKIAIDLDETLLTSNSVLYKVLTKIQTPSKVNSKLKFKPVARYGEVNVGWRKFLLSIFNPQKYYEIKDAISTINKLKEEGNQIILLTSRPHGFKPMRNLTLQWLEQNNVNYDTLVFGCVNKAMFCQVFNVDAIVDDKTKTCINSSLLGVNAINILKDSKATDAIKQKYKDNPNYYVAHSWKSIYLLIQMIRLKNIRVPEDQKTILRNIEHEVKPMIDASVKDDLVNYLVNKKLASYVHFPDRKADYAAPKIEISKKR